MTNYEKHRTEIVPIERMGRKVGIEKATKKITPCGSLNCEECLFWEHGSNCDMRALEWADAEYIEPEADWSKLAVDTPILVRQFQHNDWSRRYFSHYDNKNGLVCAFSDGKTSWTGQDDWKSWNYAKLAEVNDGI